jgi:hypothetical protein
VSARLRHDERGVSEVIGYILGFFMSFVLLMLALAVFDVRADQANRQATSIHFSDIANRVAAAALGAVEVGKARADSETAAPSDEAVYYERLRIPTQIRGQPYTISLTNSHVTVSDERGFAEEKTPLFNLQVPATCDHDEAVCLLTGSVRSSQGFVLLKYEYKRAGAAMPGSLCTSNPVNCITLG